LHERFAGWLERGGDDLPELDEIVGHHLEQALATGRSLDTPIQPWPSAPAHGWRPPAGVRFGGRTRGRPSGCSSERSNSPGPARLDVVLELQFASALPAGVAHLRRAQAVAISERTDMLNMQGDALCDLGEVLLAAGRDKKQRPRSASHSNASNGNTTSPGPPRFANGWPNSTTSAFMTEWNASRQLRRRTRLRYDGRG
jgi:hypothetical protein